jgi:hypothetical protein
MKARRGWDVVITFRPPRQVSRNVNSEHPIVPLDRSARTRSAGSVSDPVTFAQRHEKPEQPRSAVREVSLK